MGHKNEYFGNMVTMLELIWGKGYMAPGGPGNVARLLNGIDTHGKQLLDIGCGIGGPAFEMVRTHGANVVGIDIESPLIERAKRDADELGLNGQCEFRTVEPGPLEFADESFDIVISSGAFTQVGDKDGMLREVYRVLRPGGHISSYDWLKSENEISDDMRYWFEVEGLTYALETLHECRDRYINTGFVDVAAEDASDWYREEARREYELIKGELYPRMVELLGQADADHFVEDWRAMVVVIESQ